jgi:serine kinase of HPr protein (carbohydrate metabolism regulator)
MIICYKSMKMMELFKLQIAFLIIANSNSKDLLLEDLLLDYIKKYKFPILNSLKL